MSGWDDVNRPRAVSCTDPDAHGTTWVKVGSPTARCLACVVRDDLAGRSSPATLEQVAMLAGTLARPTMEVLVATGEVRAVPIAFGFLAVEQAPAKTAEVRAAKAAARAELERLSAPASLGDTLHTPSPEPEPGPKVRLTAPIPPTPPASWEPKPPEPPRDPNPRDAAYWTEERLARWRETGAESRARQMAARDLRIEEARERARQHGAG